VGYPERIPGFGITEALCCRQLSLTDRRNGIRLGFADMSVANIAVINDRIVATRNAATMGNGVLNPFTRGT
jgi:predicted nucleic acid-binding protein